MIVTRNSTKNPGPWFCPLAVLLCALALMGCRGDVTSKPPLRVIRNMDLQPKVNPQSETRLFPDRRADLLPVAGTVARGALAADVSVGEGRNPDGSFVLHGPLRVTREMLLRGRERYDIFCGPCHDRAGTGKGLVITRPEQAKFPPPPSFHEDRIRVMPDGEIFNTISSGIRTMPSYRHQVPVADRWAIIAYLRALERSQRAAAADLSPDELEKLKQ